MLRVQSSTMHCTQVSLKPVSKPRASSSVHKLPASCTVKATAVSKSKAAQQLQLAATKAVGILSSLLIASGPAMAAEQATQPRTLLHSASLGFLFNGNNPKSEYTNFHQLKALDINKHEVNFNDLSGKDFAALEDKFAQRGLVIVAFPCNQFLNQEPGDNAAIRDFAEQRKFTGLLMDKIDVNGSEASPVYNFLKEASGDESPIPWNFAKFLVKKDGSVFGRYSPKASANDLTPFIEQLLAEEK